MHVITSCTEITLTVSNSHPLLFQYIFWPLCCNKSQTKRCRTTGTSEPTVVLDLHVSQRLQRVLKSDAVQVQGSDTVIHHLGVGDELIRELLDLLRGQVPTQPVLRADQHRAAKHHLTWDKRGNRTSEERTGQNGTGNIKTGPSGKQERFYYETSFISISYLYHQLEINKLKLPLIFWDSNE